MGSVCTSKPVNLFRGQKVTKPINAVKGESESIFQ